MPQGCDVRAGEMPSGWRVAGGLYRLQYSHPLCENSLAQVAAVPMGQTLVVNGTHVVADANKNVLHGCFRLCCHRCCFVLFSRSHSEDEQRGREFTEAGTETGRVRD